MINLNMPIIPRPYNALYTFAVIFTTLFIMGFIWFALYQGVAAVQAAIVPVMSQYSGEDTYPTFELVDTFLSNLWYYFLVAVVFGLALWVYVYSQKRTLREAYYG